MCWIYKETIQTKHDIRGDAKTNNNSYHDVDIRVQAHLNLGFEKTHKLHQIVQTSLRSASRSGKGFRLQN